MEFQEHKRLIELLPEFLQQYREYQVIMDTEQAELDDIQQHISDLLSDAFTDTATEEGIARREQMYHMVPTEGASLLERRIAVRLKESKSLPYTIRRYREMLTALCGEGNYEILLDHAHYRMDVKVHAETAGREEYTLLSAVKLLTRQIIPANLVYDSALRISAGGRVYAGGAVSQRRTYQLSMEPIQKTNLTGMTVYSGGALCKRKREIIREE